MEKIQQSTYLTGLYITANRTTNQNNISKTPSITNDILISPEYDTYTSLPHPLDTRNQTVEFLKYSTYRTNLLKTEFLDYLMKEENFSNMNESEKFLREKAIENLSIINKNEREIAKKKEEYKKIILELNTEINKNLKLMPNIDEENHIQKKDDLQKKINLKISDLNVLQTLYRKEYKTRYMLVQQQKSEVENIKINLKQFEKYNILNKKIFIEVGQKESLLNDVKNYVEQSREVFAHEIDNKMKTYNELEYEVLILKKNTESIEKNLNNIKDMKNKIKELLEQRNEMNEKIFDKNKTIENNNFSLKMEIFRNTEMKNIELDSLIKNYNDIKNKMNKLKSDLFKTNQQIADLNKILHKLNDEYKEKQENKNIDKKPKKIISDKNEDLFKCNFDKYILKDKIQVIKKKNKELEILSLAKSNLLILYLKFLYEYANILYKSNDNSRLDFHFNLDNKIKFLKKILESKYYELVKWDQKHYKKILLNENEIFKEPNKFLIFGIQIFLHFFSALLIILSNILNITCYNNEDLMMKFPLSQFDKNIIAFKDSDVKDNTYFTINKESNKVEIINFNNKNNKELYKEYLSKNNNLLLQKNIILSRGIDEILKNKNLTKKISKDGGMETNYPTKVFTSFLSNKNTPNDLKNSRYINNYPSTTLLSLKRFFGKENQDKLFKGFKSADKNKQLNNRYTNMKYTQKKIESPQKMIHKNLSMIKSSRYKTNLSQIKIKENDLYLSKEYNYEIETEDNQNKVKKKNILGNKKRKRHIIKFSYEDPQKQLIFARMNDIRNLELQTNNSNNKSTSVNDVANEKIQESKFYEMYDKFKQKYFYGLKKINSRSIKNYSKINKYNSKESNSFISQSFISNKNINMSKGMKFIRNNSDFFYGTNTNKNIKSRQKIIKQNLPFIKNKSVNEMKKSELSYFKEGSKENL